jgi:hypothetical protein
MNYNIAKAMPIMSLSYQTQLNPVVAMFLILSQFEAIILNSFLLYAII